MVITKIQLIYSSHHIDRQIARVSPMFCVRIRVRAGPAISAHVPMSRTPGK